MAFASKEATLGPEIQVSMGLRLHLWVFAFKTATLAPELQVSMGTQPSSVVLCIHNSYIMTRINSLYGSQTSPVVLCMQNSVIRTRNTSLHCSQTSPVFYACKTTWLTSELLVYMCPSPHVWFLHSKQRPFDQNYKSLWDPDFACRFVQAKHHDLYQIY